MANKFHLSLPPQQQSYNPNMKYGSRRAPLTPSAILPPSISADTPAASRTDTGSSTSPQRATALLYRYASNPGSPHRESPDSTPSVAPQSKHDARPAPTRAYSTGSQLSPHSQDQWRHWSQQRQSDGYISFPDFEKYCSTIDEREERDRPRERPVVRA